MMQDTPINCYIKHFFINCQTKKLQPIFDTFVPPCIINSTLYAKNCGKSDGATAFTQDKCLHNNSNTFIQNCTMQAGKTLKIII
jgi:hypothetical protein